MVLDTGFSLEQDPAADVGMRPERNGLTVEALEAADEILLVGSADPVGLARLARAVAEAHEVLPAPVLRLVVNRMRPTLGWREADVVGMLAGFGRNVGVHFLPDDQPAVDRALVAGRTLLESGESPLTRAVAELVDAMAGGRQALNSRYRPPAVNVTIAASSGSWPVIWCLRGRSAIARSWATTAAATWPITTADTLTVASTVGW